VNQIAGSPGGSLSSSFGIWAKRFLVFSSMGSSLRTTENIEMTLVYVNSREPA